MRENDRKILLFAVILGVFLYLFLPRRLSSLCEIERNEVKSITLRYVYPEEGEAAPSYAFSEEEAGALLDLFERTYLRPVLFAKRYVRGGDALGYQFEIVYETPREDVPALGGLFTREIVSVDGRQYRFYTKALMDYISGLTEKQGQTP